MRAVRDPRSAAVIDQRPVPFDPTALAGHHYVLLVTSRRDGRRVATPMWFAADGGRRLVMRSGAGDPKLTRIRANDAVEVAPCTFRGRPLGPPMPGRARILSGEEEAAAEALLRRALGRPRRLYNLLRGPTLTMAYVEVSAPEPGLSG